MSSVMQTWLLVLQLTATTLLMTSSDAYDNPMSSTHEQLQENITELSPVLDDSERVAGAGRRSQEFDDVNPAGPAADGNKLLMDSGWGETPVEFVRVRQCETQSVSLCRGLGYNVTGWPNLVGHESLMDAEQQLRTFTPLIQYGCGSAGELRFFLCAVYVPMCTEKVPDVIGPCRPVCDRVRRRCEPILQQFGFPWPVALNCSRFPIRNDHTHMCMEGPLWGVATRDDGGDSREPDCDTSSVGCDRPDARQQQRRPDVMEARAAASATSRTSSSQQMVRCRTSGTSGATDETTPTRCRLDCLKVNNITVSSAGYENLIVVWTMVCSSVCIWSTVFVVLTFCIDNRRHDYVERVVATTSICSGVCAVALLASFAVSRPVTSSKASEPCNNDVLPVTPAPSTFPVSRDCTVIFVLVYYFTLAGAIWWTVLNLVWMMTWVFRWTDDAIRRLSTWFHVTAWTVSAILTVVVLIRHDVEVDSATGLCRIGVAASLLAVSPLIVCVIVGVVLLAIGLVHSCCCWHYKRQQVDLGPHKQDSGKSLSKLDSRLLARRICVIAVVGAVGLIGCIVILCDEFVKHRRKQTQLQSADGGVDDVDTSTSGPPVGALVTILTPLLVGIIAGPWIIVCGQAIKSWREFVRQKLHCQSRRRQRHGRCLCGKDDRDDVERSLRLQQQQQKNSRSAVDDFLSTMSVPSMETQHHLQRLYPHWRPLLTLTSRRPDVGSLRRNYSDDVTTQYDLPTVHGQHQQQIKRHEQPAASPADHISRPYHSHLHTNNRRKLASATVACKICHQQHFVEQYVI